MQNYFQQWNRGRDFPRLRASWTPIREREFFLIIARQQQNAYLSLSRPFLPSSLSLVEPSSLILSALIPPSLSNCFSPAIPLENWSTVELPVFGTRKMVDNSLEHVCVSVWKGSGGGEALEEGEGRKSSEIANPRANGKVFANRARLALDYLPRDIYIYIVWRWRLAGCSIPESWKSYSYAAQTLVPSIGSGRGDVNLGFHALPPPRKRRIRGFESRHALAWTLAATLSLQGEGKGLESLPRIFSPHRNLRHGVETDPVPGC